MCIPTASKLHYMYPYGARMHEYTHYMPYSEKQTVHTISLKLVLFFAHARTNVTTTLNVCVNMMLIVDIISPFLYDYFTHLFNILSYDLICT